MFNKLKVQFMKPIDKISLKKVVKSGLLFSIIYGVSFGIVGYISIFIPSFSFLLVLAFIVGYLLSKKIKSQQEDGHIVFRLLGVLFFIFSFYLLHSVFYTIDFLFTPLLTQKLSYFKYVYEIFNPLNTFGFLWRPWINQITFLSVFQFILDILVFSFSILFVYKNSSF
ncbi:hypothetical protein LJC17_03830 [Acholeplasma sp. OttesenSCG-928-E16]|nr:hypothetical protein [Acholeplasma sp. OttesenSCG-928-E16]